MNTIPLAIAALATGAGVATPTPQQCAAAWNLAPPPAAHDLAAHHARSAIVNAGEGFTMRWGPGGSHVTRNGPRCTVTVFAVHSTRVYAGHWDRFSGVASWHQAAIAPKSHPKHRNAILTKSGTLLLVR